MVEPLQTMMPAVKVGECRSDWEINLELAKRFNPELKRRFETVKDLINDRIKGSGYTFDDLKDGNWKFPDKDTPGRPYRRYEKGLLRQDGQPGFRTPTGKIELYCTSYEDWNMDPLPFYAEPPESEVRTPALVKKYPLIMVHRAPLPRLLPLRASQHPLAQGMRSLSAGGDSPQYGRRAGHRRRRVGSYRERPRPDQTQGKGDPHSPPQGSQCSP